MKKFIFLIIILLSTTSCTTYYTVLLTEETNLYNSTTDSTKIITRIPKDSQVFLLKSNKRKTYKKIKWGTYYGWAFNPKYTTYNSYTPVDYSPQSSYNSSSNSGGTVNVRGYTRKDGTYVRPHTRSAPRRR